jgi:RNA-directed DNA polymerase
MAETATGQRVRSFNNLYPEICSLENLYAAAKLARKRKTRKEDVERFELHRERFIRQLHEELLEERWHPGRYRQFQIHDPKTRTISAAPYRDRVVHHALVRVIGPKIERRFIDDSYSCRKGKGTSAARARCRSFTNRYRYVLKCDVRKYFESIDHEILLEKFGRVIRCKPTLSLCSRIVASSPAVTGGAVWHDGDDLFTPLERRRGLPIGNLTSQLWANLYLDGLDHQVKEEWGVPGYARYTDVFLLWSDDKAFLWACRAKVAECLQKERLTLHPKKTRIFPCEEGVPFLGFRFFPGLAPRLMGENKRRFERRMRVMTRKVGLDEMSQEELEQSGNAWVAFAREGNVDGLLKEYREQGFG